MTSGIYCIENIVNGKKYIGQSRHLEKRFKEHFQSLRRNADNCILLQYAYNEYGEKAFIFYPILKIPIFLLNIFEVFFIFIMKTHVSKGGYNISFGGNSPMKSRKHTKESKEKISKNSSKYWLGKTRDQSSIKKISISKTGKKQSKELIEKRAKSIRGKKQSHGKTSKYVGVYKRNDNGKYRSEIKFKGKVYKLGSFVLEEEAANAYDEAYKKFNKTDYSPNFEIKKEDF